MPAGLAADAGETVVRITAFGEAPDSLLLDRTLKTPSRAQFLRMAGDALARIVPAGELNLKPKLDLAGLAKFRAGLLRSPLSSAVMVSKMRDEADDW